MKRFLLLCSSFGALAAVAEPALAAARVESVTLKGAASAGAAATLLVQMNRATPLDLASCDLVVDTGDGEKPKHVTFKAADSKFKPVTHTFKKPGTYKVVVKGGGKGGCEGERSAEVKVGRPVGK